MRRIFVSFHFDPGYQDLLGAVEAVALSNEIEVLTGLDLESGGWTRDRVEERIERCDGTIAFLTRRPDSAVHDWVATEIDIAMGRHRDRLQVVLENGEALPAPLAGSTFIPLDRDQPLPAFVRLTHQITKWAREAGKPTWVRLEPEHIAALLAQHPDSRSRYRFLRTKTGEETGWREAPVHTTDRGVQVRLDWPYDDDLVMLEIVENGATVWQTTWQPQLVCLREEER